MEARSIKVKVYTRSVIAVLLFIAWGLVAFSGLLLWLAPTGPRSGQQSLLLELTKSEWGDIHFWLSISALVVTAIHVIIDWKGLRGCIRYLVSTHRGPQIGS